MTDTTLMLRYFDGDLTDEQVSELNRLLAGSPDAAKAFARVAIDQKHLGPVAGRVVNRQRRDNAAVSKQRHQAQDVRFALEHVEKREEADELLHHLSKMEQAAPLLDVSAIEPSFRSEVERKDLDGMSARQVLRLTPYLLKTVAKSKPAKWLGAAAAVALLSTVAIMFWGNETPGHIAQDPDGATPPSVEDTPALTRVVATLTAERNATWSSASAGVGSPAPDLTPGSSLRAGTRLTLTQGFAEITTNRGAIATIEAPATIELVDHDNAIRLHAGKLVGICHTEQSRGFVVRTRYADIVDLGTEFGVELKRNRMTTTVFTGEVEVEAHGGTPRSITTNQSAKLKVDGNSRSFDVDDRLAKGFDRVHAVALTKTAKLPATGQATAVGQIDPHWTIAGIDGLTLLKPVTATVADPSSYVKTARDGLRFMPNGPRSKWITPSPQYTVNESVEYQTTFDVSGFDLETLSLEMRFLADTKVTEIELNGQPLEVPTQGTGPAFTEMTELTLQEGFLAGQNTLTFTVQRHRIPEHAQFWTGLRVELELTSQRTSVGPSE